MCRGRHADRIADAERSADKLAREFVGPRWQSVFATPPAEVFTAETYVEANVIATQLLDGKKISQQAWALRQNIKRVAEIADGDRRIIELHPEVSFRASSAVPWPFRRRLERTGDTP